MINYDQELYKQIVIYYQQLDSAKNDTTLTGQSRTISHSVEYAESTDHSV